MTTSDTKKTYVFTDSQDWFSFNAETWRLLFPRIRSASPRVLEIGSWEGRSAVFLLDELCGESGSLTCIDHFDLKQTPAGCQRYMKVTHNLSATGKAFRIMDQFSVPALMTLLEEEMSSSEPGFDFIYVDGSHEADDTFLDGELAWRLARKGAIVIFDDYRWSTEPQDSRHHPKRGIDAFMSLHAEEYEKLSSPTQYQMVLQKTSDMRIGFLVKARTSENTQSFGYGINIAYTIDKAYAMPLAVSLRSLLLYTPGRVSAYILTQNMSNDLQEKIRQSLPLRDDFTLQFLELGDREEMLAFKFGMTWAKIDLIDIIPTERVLYLDADTLIRQDIRPMWETDLCGKPLAAIQDIGYPLGREESSRVPYFNAGVLLLDLAQIRQSKVQLLSQAFTQRNSHFRDQDALNAHFAGNWHALPLAWNAQGLGTYAKLSSTERDALDLSAMFPPRIVHFTGPVHPSMNAILNDWGQPYTAKPWGYAGAPGHPFAREWWEILEETAWKGYRSDTEFAKICEDEAKKAEETGVACFRERVAASSRSI